MQTQYSPSDKVQVGKWLNTQDISRMACGCPACDGGVQDGHFACSQADAGMVEAEANGLVSRAYDGGAWRWFRV